MADLDLRIRLFAALLRRLPGANITRMTPEQIAAAHDQPIPHNRIIDALFGGVAPGIRHFDWRVPSPNGDIPVRVYRPECSADCPRPLIVNFHGGGFALGNLDQGDSLCSHVSAGVDAVVVSVDYRLAPLHPFPAAVDDSWAALCWAVDQAADFGADRERVGVMGDSAGGNLAAVMCLFARDNGGPRLRHQALIYPATDMRVTEQGLHTGATRDPILPPEDIEVFHRFYLGGDASAVDDWRASPACADSHRDLPPALIQLAEHDPLAPNGHAYARMLRNAAVPTRVTEYVGMPHGFLSFPGVCRAAPQARAELIAEQRLALVEQPAAHLG